MEIRLPRSEFLAELNPMLGIAEKKTTIPVLSHLLLSARGSRLSLAATDLDVSLTSWCDADVAQPGGIAVQARKFTEIIRSLGGDEVELVLEEPRILAIRSGRSRFKIHGLSPDDFPTLPTLEASHRVEISLATVKRMISKVFFAVSAEESRFQLNGALIRLKGESVEMVATDGHRLALVEQAVPQAGEDSVLAPRKALQELQRFEGDGQVVFARGEHHLSFGLGRRELICRILEGTFPDYERVIAKDNEHKATFERRILTEAVQRVALMAGDRARAVRLALGDQAVVVSAVNQDLGEAVEEIPCDYAGPEIKIGINPDYMGQFLAAVETDKVRFDLKDENTQCVGYPVDGSDVRYLCVIMPMRI